MTNRSRIFQLKISITIQQCCYSKQLGATFSAWKSRTKTLHCPCTQLHFKCTWNSTHTPTHPRLVFNTFPPFEHILFLVLKSGIGYGCNLQPGQELTLRSTISAQVSIITRGGVGHFTAWEKIVWIFSCCRWWVVFFFCCSLPVTCNISFNVSCFSAGVVFWTFPSV